ncbi:hypothetical protein AVEN_239062-1 [Araneus ventricosus]|uniref:Uncharacterized protein n=1 Tax=Araneus ventricosus TaxID=182803 RepID=A0A4Y2INN2_ARAVE|nr:hypothetical protein AVEN_239062-1 [Araneus ventricosus]
MVWLPNKFQSQVNRIRQKVSPNDEDVQRSTAYWYIFYSRVLCCLNPILIGNNLAIGKNVGYVIILLVQAMYVIIELRDWNALLLLNKHCMDDQPLFLYWHGLLVRRISSHAIYGSKYSVYRTRPGKMPSLKDGIRHSILDILADSLVSIQNIIMRLECLFLTERKHIEHLCPNRLDFTMCKSIEH